MVKIRLARRGRKKLAMYDLVVANATAPRDGRFIEKIGTYNPNTIPATIELSEDRAVQWLMNGAQPTDTARAILSYRGVLFRKHLQVGVNKGALTQEEADARLAAWKETKNSRISGRVDSLARAKADAAKARLEAEQKVNEARMAAQAARQAAEIAAAAPVAEAEEAAAEEVQAEAPAAASVAEETPAAETAAQEAPAAEAAPEAAAQEAPAAEVVAAAAPEEAAGEPETPSSES